MLIVEDHARMRSALRDYLQSAYPTFSIFEAADGASAVELCRAHEFSVVLLDVRLPDANGIDLIATIREIRPECEIVVVSQFAIPAYAERARAEGAFAYVTKNAIFHELTPAIDRALEARSLR